jgi:hypothetical protein
MPSRVWVANQELLAADLNSYVQQQVVATFANTADRATAMPSPTNGAMAWIQAASPYLCVYNGSAWVTLTPQAALVATQETTTSAAYVNLATVGPAVTLETGARALVTVSALSANAGSGGEQASYMAPAVSGATTRAANDDQALRTTQSANAGTLQASFQTLMTGLTPGVNTFTAQYKTTSGSTGSFARRNLTVVALP